MFVDCCGLYWSSKVSPCKMDYTLKGRYGGGQVWVRGAAVFSLNVVQNIELHSSGWKLLKSYVLFQLQSSFLAEKGWMVELLGFTVRFPKTVIYHYHETMGLMFCAPYNLHLMLEAPPEMQHFTERTCNAVRWEWIGPLLTRIFYL